MNSSKLTITPKKSKSPIKNTTKAKSPIKNTTTKFKSVKKELVKFANKNKKTLTRAAIGSTVLGLYAINRKAIHEGLGKSLNRVTKQTQHEFVNNVKDATKETIDKVEGLFSKKNTEDKTIIQENINGIIKDNVYLVDTVIPKAVNKILKENKDLASDIVKDSIVKLIIQGKDNIVNNFTNLIGYAASLNQNINQNVDDIVINIVAKNNAFSEEEKQQIKDVEEYLIFQQQLQENCSNYFRIPGGFPCENQGDADKLVIKYVFSPEFQKLVKEFQELKLVGKIEKYLIDTLQLESVCSTRHQTYIDYFRSCNDKDTANKLVNDSIQKYKTDNDFKKKVNTR